MQRWDYMSEKKEKTVAQWLKVDILGFSCYRHRRDLLQVLLEDGVLYSKEDVNKIIKEFEQGAI